MSRVFRTISQFAEEEIVLPPTGPFPEQPFSIERQPYVKLWFDLIESGKFIRFAVTGPTQTGKTLCCFVIPAMYHLFEIGENVACGIPQMAMAMDKWNDDFLPAIKASRYASLLPDEGVGSQGGKFESITFKNGATLRFLSAEGKDAKRSGVTARVLVMTEVDKYDEAKATSRESDPVTQMIERLGAFAALNTVVYMECTVSIETGRIWVEYTNGSAGRIATQCPHCRNYVTLERKDLHGWQEAGNELDARAWAHFVCPDCQHPWSEDERIEANKNAKLVHKGQEITPDGVVTGHPPKTLTAGFRWNAANNLFKPAADFGWREWTARFAPDEKNSEKGLLQFMWARPVPPDTEVKTPLKQAVLMVRQHSLSLGVAPNDTECLSIGVDVGGRWLHVTIGAYGPRPDGKVIDHLKVSVPKDTLGLEAGVLFALRALRGICEAGWKTESGNRVLTPDVVLIDSGWKGSRESEHTNVIYDFVVESGWPYRATKGLATEGKAVQYSRPKSTGAVVVWIGDGWHISRLKMPRIDLLEFDADVAKSRLHERLACDISLPGAITLFHVDNRNRDQVVSRAECAKQLCGEIAVVEAGVTKWERVGPNHFLDSAVLMDLGANVHGVRLTQPELAEPSPEPRRDEERGSFIRPMNIRNGDSWVRRRT